MNWRSCKLVSRLLNIGSIAAVLCSLLFQGTLRWVLLGAAIALMLASAVVVSRFWRCPKCGELLAKGRSPQCPRCGWRFEP